MYLVRDLLGKEKKLKESSDPPIFYHYTSRSAADAISREGRIRNLTKNGIVLTTMAPDHYYRNEILLNNYGEDAPPYLQNRADYCVRVRSSKLTKSKLKKIEWSPGKIIYLYDGEIIVNELDVFDKPTCMRSPQTMHSDVQHPISRNVQPIRSSSGSTPGQISIISIYSGGETNHNSHVLLKKSKCLTPSEIKVDLRSDVKFYQSHMPLYQDENVTIFAFEWMKDGLKKIRASVPCDISVNIADSKTHYNLSGDFSLKDLQIVSRNESSNTNGEINFSNYIGIRKEVVYSLKDLNRQCVIIGKDRTTNYGGYPDANKRVRQSDTVYVCDLIGLQFQQKYNSGRLVLVGADLPKGLLDEFIYEEVVNEKKPTIEEVRSDHSGRFIECCDVFFDSKAYVKFVANDVVLAGIAINKCASEPLNFKFLKYGTGYFAGPFRHLLDRFIGEGVAEGLKNLLRRLPENHLIKRIELPFFDPCPSIDEVCSKHIVEIKYSKDDALKNTRYGFTTATTNSADPHTMTGNKMGFGSVDGSIAENLCGKAIKFSPIINKLMKERFV